MKNLDTNDPVSATVTVPVDVSYIGKNINVNSSEDDISWSKVGIYVGQDDGK